MTCIVRIERVGLGPKLVTCPDERLPQWLHDLTAAHRDMYIRKVGKTPQEGAPVPTAQAPALAPDGTETPLGGGGGMAGGVVTLIDPQEWQNAFRMYTRPAPYWGHDVVATLEKPTAERPGELRREVELAPNTEAALDIIEARADVLRGARQKKKGR